MNTLTQIEVYKGIEHFANYPVNNGHIVLYSTLPYEVKRFLYQYASGQTKVTKWGEWQWGWKT